MRKKIDLFEVHMKKVIKLNGIITIICNYCFKEFKWSKFGGYDTYWRHITNTYPTESTKSKAKGQTQIARYVSPNTFRYSDTNNREELARMVDVKYLPFNLVRKLVLLITVNKH